MPELNFVEVGDWYSNEQCPYYYHGLTTAQNDIGRDFYVPAGLTDWVRKCYSGTTHAFSVVISALALTKKPIRQLRAGQWHGDDGYANCDRLWDIEIGQLPALTSYRLDGLRASFRTLRTMNLTVSFLDIYDEGKREKENWLPNFVSVCENVQHLTITGDGWCRWNYNRNVNDQPAPASCRGMSKFFKGVKLDHLTHFTLQNVAIEPFSFHEDFMRNHKWTLSHLELRKVAMQTISWAQYFRDYHNELMRSCRSYKVSWLEQWHTKDEMHKEKDKCSVVIFDNAGLVSCDNCRSKLDVQNNTFEPIDCKHTSKTFTWSDIKEMKMNTIGCLKLGEAWGRTFSSRL